LTCREGPHEFAVIKTGLDPSSLTLEITESALMQNLTTSAAVIRRLHAMAVRLHIDDFGTGYSSLSYLQNFPIHCNRCCTRGNG
jgi:EAL domain-containing protein (putative c-di-GMP-specific phosphodiesterase class I)